VVFNCFRKRVYNANNIKLFDNIIWFLHWSMRTTGVREGSPMDTPGY